MWNFSGILFESLCIPYKQPEHAPGKSRKKTISSYVFAQKRKWLIPNFPTITDRAHCQRECTSNPSNSDEFRLISMDFNGRLIRLEQARTDFQLKNNSIGIIPTLQRTKTETWRLPSSGRLTSRSDRKILNANRFVRVRMVFRSDATRIMREGWISEELRSRLTSSQGRPSR